MKGIRYISLLILLLGFQSLAAQEVVRKASKTEEKVFEKDISQVSVYGEKAQISVKGWESNTIKVILKPVSRNKVEKQAIEDLKYIKYYAEKEGNLLVIRNSFRGEAEKITSNLGIEIEVFVPQSIPVSITNLYGPVYAADLNEVDTEISFGSLRLTKINTSGTIQARYSNMELNAIRGELTVNAEKSDIMATDLSAHSIITTSYGKTDLYLSGNGDLAVNGYRTAIDITLESLEKYNFRLEAAHGGVNLPARNEPIKTKVEIRHPDSTARIEATTSYCDINIKLK